jgi:predicted nucleic acid-binding protein
VLFWDTSALVKAYSKETGTPTVLGALKLKRGHGSLSDLVAVEVHSVLAKHLRVGKLTKAEYRTAVATFTGDYSGAFDIVEVEQPMRRAAFQLAHTYRASGLGAMDLLHLASAVHLDRHHPPEPIVFATSDAALQTAAAAEGLRTFNPETDPLSKLLKLLAN